MKAPWPQLIPSSAPKGSQLESYCSRVCPGRGRENHVLEYEGHREMKEVARGQ